MRAMNGACFGSAQARLRLILVAFKGGFGWTWPALTHQAERKVALCDKGAFVRPEFPKRRSCKQGHRGKEFRWLALLEPAHGAPRLPPARTVRDCFVAARADAGAPPLMPPHDARLVMSTHAQIEAAVLTADFRPNKGTDQRHDLE